MASRYEQMRRDPANWTFGVAYACRDDPRVIVRNLSPFGWTWNFGHPRVVPGIALAVATVISPALLVWAAGLRSWAAIAISLAVGLGAVVFAASRLARDPGGGPADYTGP